ncbi:ABC transporter permease [Agromyces sp. Root1464]|uniref:ABC transporter permease n=1 Tax=Agromyces sp. Root1464 TaxID=1736467 RepID=UPI000A6FF7FD|nr:ABC transporter permease [Agromyces sp. Root1464]
MSRRMRLGAVSVASVVLAVLLWYLASDVWKLAPSVMLPSPVTVWSRFIWMLGNPYQGSTLMAHLWASLQVVVAGWIIAVLVGVPLGVLFGWNRRMREYLEPLFNLIRPIPPIAWTPFALLWFGITPGARIFVVVMAAFAPCVINAYEAVRGVDPALIGAARVAGASRMTTLRGVVVPTALPRILIGTNLALTGAWMTLVAAELLAAQAGIGYMMQIARSAFQADIIMVGMILIGLLGILMTFLLKFAFRRVLVWDGASREH